MDLQKLTQMVMLVLRLANGMSIEAVIIEVIEIWVPNISDGVLAEIAEKIAAVHRVTQDPDFLWVEINAVLAQFVGEK